MSGIVCILNLDGSPVDPALLQRMSDLLAHRGPDGTGQWIHGNVGLAHRSLQTTEESLQEQQPLEDSSKQLCLTFDGRIDNRSELLTNLIDSGVRPRDST